MILELDGLSHRYGTEEVLADVSFELEAGELVALLGPSGCGKTTVVQAIAGHVRPTGGRIRLRGEDVTDVPPESRRVGLVFQQSTLFPHLSVRENVEYGLRARDVAADERAELVSEYLELVDLHEQRNFAPAELSGGQKRRVELARALAPQPDVLLLDEPLSGLDRALRDRLQNEIARIQRETGVTTLFVTHDQEEAMALADRLVVMNDGRVAGIGQPRELYESPPTPFVGSFLGRSNTLPATVVDQEPPRIEIDGQDLASFDPADDRSPGSPVSCHVRPKDLRLVSWETNGDTPTLRGEVRRVADLGRRYDVTVQTPSGETVVVEQSSQPPATGEEVRVAVPEGELTVFDGSKEGAEQTDSRTK